MSQSRISIVFVCLGNICRSPLAESVFRHLIRERGLEERFHVDSAGTSGYHAGDPPDSRSVATARRRGIVVEGRSRQLRPEDLARFDYVVAMDAENEASIRRLAARIGGGTARIHRLREWDEGAADLDVPDPYYGGPRGFDDVHDMVERSCARLLEHILENAERVEATH